MEALIMAGQLLLALSILVGVHEAGHMFAAKAFGMRVEKFSIGFPPKIFGFKYGETEYSIGAVPLGGFVKISGMIDESLDTDKMSSEPEPHEFRAKPAWQRLIVMMGGIIVNIITGIFIFIMVTYYYGEEYLTAEEVNKRGIVALDLAQEIGLQTGDRIIKVNGREYQRFPEVLSADVLLTSGSYYTVLRNGDTVHVEIPDDFVGRLSDRKDQFIMPMYPFDVGRVVDGTPADQAGLQEGDQIVRVGEHEINYFHELQAVLGDYASKEVEVDVVRNDEKQTLSVKVDENGRIGFVPRDLLEKETQYYSLGEAIPKGTHDAFAVITNTVRGFSKIFRGEIGASQSISGPIGIAREFGGQWIWQKFWILTGLLSMVLAFMNFLPIPALDGGHVVFLLYEMVAGRKPSDKFLENAQKVGMVILLSLMVFAFGNDIIKIFT
ncbi:RIP metalloprotease RseP [Cytophagaceae bacterium ABcell3]|nr:RIP metalloprotease RseP [Cytophagaceae bacterium ABcell3]